MVVATAAVEMEGAMLVARCLWVMLVALAVLATVVVATAVVVTAVAEMKPVPMRR